MIHTEAIKPYKTWTNRCTDLYFCRKITSIRTVDKFQGKFGKVICESVHVTRQKHIINGAPAAPTSICGFFLMNECVSCDYPEPCGVFHQVAYFERGGGEIKWSPLVRHSSLGNCRSFIVFFDKEVKSKNMFLVFTFFISMPMIPAQPDVLTLFFGSDPKMSNAQAEITTAAWSLELSKNDSKNTYATQ